MAEEIKNCELKETELKENELAEEDLEKVSGGGGAVYNLPPIEGVGMNIKEANAQKNH